MKGVLKGVLLALIVFSTVCTAQFGTDIQFQVKLPARSRWGVPKMDKSIDALSKSCLAQDLSGVSIGNNGGAKGSLQGKTQAFQLCPCLAAGVTYWNPLSIVNSSNPCTLSHFSPLSQSDTSLQCAGIDAAIASGTSQASSGAPSAQHANLMSQLSSKFSSIPSGNKKYTALHDAVYAQAEFIINTSRSLTPNVSQGQDFLSVPYLRFCTSFGDSYVTPSLLNDSAQELFGRGVDISTYFPNGSFVVSLDLTQEGSDDSGTIREKQAGSSVLGGALIRAVEQGYLSAARAGTAPSALSFFKSLKPISPEYTQKLIDRYASGASSLLDSPEMIGERAVLEEVFFLHMSMMQPLELFAGLEGAEKHSDIGKDAQVNQQDFVSLYDLGASSTSLADLYAKFFAAARYTRGLYLDENGNRPEYAPQPVDTFYGALVINNGQFRGADGTFKDIDLTQGFGSAFFKTGTVAELLVSGGIDQWNVAGINSFSGLKYRSISFDVTSLDGTTLFGAPKTKSLGRANLQIEEGKGGDVYSDNKKKIYPAGISLVDTLNNVRTNLVASDLIQKFFEVSPSSPWAVVLELVNETASDRSKNPEPTFRLLGLARLHPDQFPLKYLAGDMEGILLKPFALSDLFDARAIFYDKITHMAAQKVSSQSVQASEINTNLVKFRGALSYGWGGKDPLEKGFEGLSRLQTDGFLTRESIKDVATLTNLVKQADGKPDPKSALVPVGSRSFAMLGL